MSDEKKKTDNDVKVPVYKKWWFWVIIVLLVIVVFGGSSSNESKKVEDGGESGDNTSQQESTKEPENYKVGDTIEVSKSKITVNSIVRNYDTGNQFINPKEGKEFIRINVTIENGSDKKLSVGPYYWELKDANGVIVDVASIQYTEDSALSSVELANGGKITGDLFYEVDQDAGGLVLQYKNNIFSSKTVDINL